MHCKVRLTGYTRTKIRRAQGLQDIMISHLSYLHPSNSTIPNTSQGTLHYHLCGRPSKLTLVSPAYVSRLWNRWFRSCGQVYSPTAVWSINLLHPLNRDGRSKSLNSIVLVSGIPTTFASISSSCPNMRTCRCQHPWFHHCARRVWMCSKTPNRRYRSFSNSDFWICRLQHPKEYDQAEPWRISSPASRHCSLVLCRGSCIWVS